MSTWARVRCSRRQLVVRVPGAFMLDLEQPTDFAEVAHPTDDLSFISVDNVPNLVSGGGLAQVSGGDIYISDTSLSCANIGGSNAVISSGQALGEIPSVPTIKVPLTTTVFYDPRFTAFTFVQAWFSAYINLAPVEINN